MRAVITVLDSINPTTMPYNEFILYRDKRYSDEKQILLLTGREISVPRSDIPDSLEIHSVGKNPLKIRRELKSILNGVREKGDTYIIHLHSIRGAFSTFVAMTGLMKDAPTVYTVHSTFTGFKLHNKILSFCDAMLSNYVTCVSETSYKAFPKLPRKLKGHRMLKICNGVNTERIDAFVKESAIHKRDDDRVSFVYVARLIPIKNHKFLIDVIAKTNTRCKFIFVGLEDNAHSVRKYAEEKGVIDRIVFTGVVPRKKVYEILRKADVYISTSTLEGLPVSVLEGMYCGLPTILSDIPQHREIAGGAAFIPLVGFDADVWADTINDFCNMTHDDRNAIAEKCRNLAKQRFSLNSMHRNYDVIYQKIESRY